MTVEKFIRVIKQHHIPYDATIYSDSGTELCETEADCVYYYESKNQLILTMQREERWETVFGAKCIYDYKQDKE